MNTVNEPHNSQLDTALETIRRGAIAGAAGGLAEIAWVTLYATATAANPATLARGVTTAAGMTALFPADPIALGVTVHMGIAVMLGIALAFVWQALSSRRAQTMNPFPFTVAALAAVWMINFFVVLPVVSPTFIQLVPYSVSLISKLLFGLAAGVVFRQLAASALNVQRARVARKS
jgi:hypothetical protein